MADDFLSNLASGLRVWGGVSDAFHKRDVSNRIDQIMQASNGGQTDLGSIDPALTSDGVGLEAMGQVAAKLSQTKQAQNQIFQNALIGANNQFKMATQYKTDFDKAVAEGRQSDATNLLISMGNSMGIPYRYSLGEDGRIAVKHVTPDGETDMGSMSLVEAGRMATGYLKNQDQFVRNSVMHNMAMADTNAQIQAAGASKWMHGIDPKTGRQIMAFPQYNLENGQVEYFVQGIGKVNAEQLSQLGVQWGSAAQMARIGLRSAGLVGGHGGGAGLGGSSRGGHKATPGQVQTAYTREFNRGMADLGYTLVKGRWVRHLGGGLVEEVDVHDDDFVTAASTEDKKTREILKSRGFDTDGYKPRYGGGSQPSTPDQPSGGDEEARQALKILLEKVNQKSGAK